MNAVAAPALLVFLSSTSFIAARAVAPHVDPILFLFVRFLLVALFFAILARNVPWPKGWHFIGHLLAGMVINDAYLVASWWAVGHGLAAGVMTLMGALQPLFAALLVVAVLRNPIGRSAWIGLALGFAGVALVILPRLVNVDAEGLPLLPVALGLFSIIALTTGTMVQKSSLSKADLRATGAIQHLGAALVAGIALPIVGAGPLGWLARPMVGAGVVRHRAVAGRNFTIRLDDPAWGSDARDRAHVAGASCDGPASVVSVRRNVKRSSDHWFCSRSPRGYVGSGFRSSLKSKIRVENLSLKVSDMRSCGAQQVS